MDHQNHHCKALHQVCQHKSCPFQFAFSIWAHQWTTRITIARPCTRFASTNHAHFNLPSASGHTNGPPESPLQGPAPGLPAQIMPISICLQHLGTPMDHQNHHCKALHQVCQHKSCPFQFAFSIWAHQWTTRITIARPCTRFASTNHALSDVSLEDVITFIKRQNVNADFLKSLRWEKTPT